MELFLSLNWLVSIIQENINNFDTEYFNDNVKQQCSFSSISNSNTFLTIENRNCSCFGASFKRTLCKIVVVGWEQKTNCN